jgi:integrase
MGVEPRAKSIRIRRVWRGIVVSETITVNGTPLPPNPRNIAHAERLDAQILQALKLGTYRRSDFFEGAAPGSEVGAPTVEGYLKKWNASRLNAAQSTIDKDAGKITFWVGTIGKTPIQALIKSQILEALALRPTWSGKTINNYVSILRSALALAVDDGALASNPCVTIKAAKHQREEPDPFTEDEQVAIIEHFRANGPPSVYNYVAFGFGTGLRTNELLGLRWSTVEIPKRRITVIDGLVNGKMTGRTKTATARQVHLNDAPLEALRRQKALSFVGQDRVFTHPVTNGPWMHDQQFRTGYWAKVLKRLGIRHRGPYNMRHTRATALLMQGVNPALAAKQMGHDLRTFLTVYAKWIPSSRDADELSVMDAKNISNIA